MIGKKLLILSLCLLVFIGIGEASTLRLKEDTLIHDIKFIRGTLVLFWDGKVRLAYLPQGQEIQEIRCIGWVKFYESGQLQNAYLFDSQKIQGAKLLKGSLIEFYESGRLKEVVPSENQTIQGIEVSKGWWVKFYESGEIKSAWSSKNQKIWIGTYWVGVPKGRQMLFDKKGILYK